MTTPTAPSPTPPSRDYRFPDGRIARCELDSEHRYFFRIIAGETDFGRHYGPFETEAELEAALKAAEAGSPPSPTPTPSPPEKPASEPAPPQQTPSHNDDISRPPRSKVAKHQIKPAKPPVPRKHR